VLEPAEGISCLSEIYTDRISLFGFMAIFDFSFSLSKQKTYLEPINKRK